jgi:predicted nucleic acid-binding protein
MTSLDANLILRYILRDIPNQSAKAQALITGSVCHVSDVIVTEIAFVLERKLGSSRADVGLILKKFIGLRTIKCNAEQLQATIDLFEATAKLSFPDCYAAIEARRSGNSLATFDKDLIKYGGSHVYEP